MLGGHPTVAEGEVNRTVYFDSDGSPEHPTDITVTNCHNFYVYHLHEPNVPAGFRGRVYCSNF